MAKFHLLTFLLTVALGANATIPLEGFEFQVLRTDPPEMRICGPTKGTLFEGDLVIPDSVLRPIDGRMYAVVEIGAYNGNIRDTICGLELPRAFFDQPLITSVTIPKTVTEIWRDSFRGCPGIKSWNVDPENPVYVSWDGVLYTKSPGTGVPNELMRFPAASPLTEWTIPPVNDDMYYGSRFVLEGAFYDNSNLKTLVIDPTVWLKSASLLGNKGITTFKGSGGRTGKLSHGVIVSEDGTTLYHVPPGYTGALTMPEGVTRIHDYAMAGTHCKSINFNNVTEIGSRAFMGAAFTEFTIPESVTSIDYALFENCRNLKTVTIGTRIKYVASYMFRDCTSLESVSLPTSCKGLRNQAFNGCRSLTAFSLANYTMLGNGQPYVDEAHFAFTGLTKMNWPSKVASVPDKMFFGCQAFKSISLKETTDTIGEFAFYGSGIETFNTTNLSWIKDYALQGCLKLKKIVIAESDHTLKIGPNCFQLNPGTELYLDHKDLYYQGWNTLPNVKDDWDTGAFQGQMDEIRLYTSLVNPEIFLPRWFVLYCPALTFEHYSARYSRGNVCEMFSIARNNDSYEVIPNYDWVKITAVAKTAAGLDVRYTVNGVPMHSTYPEDMLALVGGVDNLPADEQSDLWKVENNRLVSTCGNLEIPYLCTVDGRRMFAGVLPQGESIGLPTRGVYILCVRRNGHVSVHKILN